MKIKQFYQTYRLYIFPSVVALSSIFLIIFAIYPQTIKLVSNEKTAGELLAKSKFLDSKVSALESYNIEDLSKKLELAQSAYPAEKDFASVFGLLQQLVSGSGFTVTSISLGAGGKTANADSFSVKLDIKGSKALLQNLLDNLESSPRLTKIATIDVSSNQPSGSIDVSLMLELLYALPPVSAGGPDSSVPELNQKDEQTLITLSRTAAMVPKTTQVSQKGKSNPFE